MGTAARAVFAAIAGRRLRPNARCENWAFHPPPRSRRPAQPCAQPGEKSLAPRPPRRLEETRCAPTWSPSPLRSSISPPFPTRLPSSGRARTCRSARYLAYGATLDRGRDHAAATSSIPSWATATSSPCSADGVVSRPLPRQHEFMANQTVVALLLSRLRGISNPGRSVARRVAGPGHAFHRRLRELLRQRRGNSSRSAPIS